MKRSLLLGTVLAALAVVGAPAPAHADKPTSAQDRADGLFEKGQADYQAGDFQGAIEYFKHAYEAVHDPVYLFNIAQSYRKILDCEQAYDYYQRYLDAAPNAENRDKVSTWLRELTPCVEQRRKEHEAAKKGEEVERERKAEQERKAAAAASASADAASGEDHGHKLRLAGIATASGGGVAMIVGIVFAVKGSHAKSDIAAECSPPMTCNWDAGPSSLDSTGRRDNVIAYLGIGVGSAAIVAGATMYVLGRMKLEHVAVTPVESGGGAGAAIAARLTF